MAGLVYEGGRGTRTSCRTSFSIEDNIARRGALMETLGRHVLERAGFVPFKDGQSRLWQRIAVAAKEVAMGDRAEDPAAAPETPEMVDVTVSVPIGLLADYDRGVTAGIYSCRSEAIRHGLTESWRHHRGRYYTLRLDLLDPEDLRPDTNAEVEPEASKPEAGHDNDNT